MIGMRTRLGLVKYCAVLPWFSREVSGAALARPAGVLLLLLLRFLVQL